MNFGFGRHIACLILLLLVAFTTFVGSNAQTSAAAQSKDDGIDPTYTQLAAKCAQLQAQTADPKQRVSACQDAAAEADRLPDTSEYVQRTRAYVAYANALIRSSQPQAAISVGEKAIAVVKQGHGDDAGSSAAYQVTGEARALTGDFAGADEDLSVAENYERKAIAGAAGSSSKSYTQTLKDMLHFHSQVLYALGKQAAAQAKIQEADRLS